MGSRRADVGIGVYVKNSKVHKRALQLTHIKRYHLPQAEPRPETEPKSAERIPSWRGQQHLRRSEDVREKHQAFFSGKKIIHDFLSMTCNSTVMHILSNVAMTREH
jgi:hypothetical protein